MPREMMNDENVEKVVGGFLHFNENTMVLTYYHEETGAITTYEIVKKNRAWGMSNALHAQNLHEDVIIQKMLADGCIR